MSQIPVEIQQYVAIKKKEKLLSQELKSIRHHADEYQLPVMSWMAQHEVDQLKLSSAGLCIERIDSEKAMPLSKAQRDELIVQFFTQVDDVQKDPQQRAADFIAWIDNREHRVKKRVAKLSCRMKNTPSTIME